MPSHLAPPWCPRGLGKQPALSTCLRLDASRDPRPGVYAPWRGTGCRWGEQIGPVPQGEGWAGGGSLFMVGVTSPLGSVWPSEVPGPRHPWTEGGTGRAQGGRFLARPWLCAPSCRRPLARALLPGSPAPASVLGSLNCEGANSLSKQAGPGRIRDVPIAGALRPARLCRNGAHGEDQLGLSAPCASSCHLLGGGGEANR